MKERNYTTWIVMISVVVPALVAVLYILPKRQINPGFNISILPALHATLNFVTTLLLLAGWFFIRKRRIVQHKACMISAFVLSGIFLVSYVVYHSLAQPTHFGGVGIIRPVYFFLLITHIILAAAILPFILVTLSRALSERFDKHRKIARITLPLWLYVTITGVVVYLMLSPYY